MNIMADYVSNLFVLRMMILCTKNSTIIDRPPCSVVGEEAVCHAIHKCFTYVTKTIANLTTYSKKTGDYNGTIIFEIDTIKKSSPINLNLCQT